MFARLSYWCCISRPWHIQVHAHTSILTHINNKDVYDSRHFETHFQYDLQGHRSCLVGLTHWHSRGGQRRKTSFYICKVKTVKMGLTLSKWRSLPHFCFSAALLALWASWLAWSACNLSHLQAPLLNFAGVVICLVQLSHLKPQLWPKSLN